MALKPGTSYRASFTPKARGVAISSLRQSCDSRLEAADQRQEEAQRAIYKIRSLPKLSGMRFAGKCAVYHTDETDASYWHGR